MRRSTCARPRELVFLLCTTIPPSVINTAAAMPRTNSSPELKQRVPHGGISPDSSAWVATASPSEEQRSQRACCAKTLRAAGLSAVGCVGSVLTAPCQDVQTSPVFADWWQVVERRTRVASTRLAALTTAKIPRRSTPRSFQTGSKPRVRPKTASKNFSMAVIIFPSAATNQIKVRD